MENETNTAQTEITPAPKESGMGATLGIVVIILVLVAGGLYVWMTKNTSAPVSEDQALSESADPETAALMEVGTSDSASAIEADLNMTDTGDASGDLQLQ